MDRSKAKRDTVVIIHGFGGKRLWMQPLSLRFKRDYDVINWSYFSLGGSIDRHASRFAEFLNSIDAGGKINIVAHSMGSIIARAALQKHRCGKVNRVVLLAPPNSGSHVARYAGLVLGSICKPISELSSAETSYVNQLPNSIEYETGVIASKFDILVPVENTKMDGLSDYRIVNGTHNSLLFSGRIATMANQFIQTGRFAA